MRTVVITGASAGVGRATVREFARWGKFNIALLARGHDGLEAAAREVNELGSRALVIPCDVGKYENVELAAARVEQDLGPIDIWINNAMVSLYSPFWDITPAEYQHVTEVTYLGQVWGTMVALKRMLPRDRGHIVQVGSALAHRSIPLQSAYCGGKHAVAGFTESVRTELLHQKSSVVITLVNLPGVNTTQFEWTKNKMAHECQPVGKIYEPEVAADAIYFAAHAQRKEFNVGWPTVESVLGEKIAPRLMDRYIADHMWEGSQRKNVPHENRPDNFWQPVAGDHGARGPFTSKSVDSSAQVWASKNRAWLTVAGVGIALATAGTWMLSSRRTGDAR